MTGVDDDPSSDWNNTVEVKEYEKRLGLKLDCTLYTTEAWATKSTLLFAGDELPDLLTCRLSPMSRSDVVKYAQDGYLLDFSQYLDLMPNVKRMMDQYPDFKSALYLDDGGIYAFPQYLNGRPDAGLITPHYMASAWVDNLGLEQPKSLDDLYEVLKAVKEQDANGNGDPNDEIPFLMSGGTSEALRMILWAYGINVPTSLPYLLRDDGGKVSLWDTSENYKAYLKYLNRLYEEGLINQDAFVLTWGEMESMCKERRAFITRNAWTTRLQEELTPEGTFTGRNDDGWLIQEGFTSEYNPEQWYVLGPRVTSGYGFMANAETEYPEEIAKFIDYLFTDEGAISASNGYEGLTFDYEECAGTKLIGRVLDPAIQEIAAQYDTPERFRVVYSTCGGAGFSTYLTGAGTIYEMLANATDEQLAAPDGEAYL